MKSFYFSVIAACFFTSAFSQNVGIGENNPASKATIKGNLSVGSGYSTTAAPTNGAIIEGQVGIGVSSPNANAALDVTSTNKGMLIPRVALVTTTNPISGTKPDGLMVYNTSTTGTYSTPGIYMWSSTAGDWVRIITNTTLSSSLQNLTNQAGGGLGTFSYNGSSAVQIGIASQGVQTGMIANDAVTTTQIAPNTITSADMGPNSVDLSSGVVTNLLPVNRGGTNTNTLGSNGTIAYSNGTSYGFSPVGTAGQVLLSGGTGQPTWSSPNAALTKKDITSGTTGVSITNGTGQVVGASNVTVTVATNSASSPGLVPAGTGNNNKVWGTDGAGNPTWTSVSNAQLANSGVTVNTGTGLSGGGTVSLGGTLNLANTGVTSLTGTANQVNVSQSTGAITLSTPQNIHTGANVTFNSVTAPNDFFGRINVIDTRSTDAGPNTYDNEVAFEFKSRGAIAGNPGSGNFGGLMTLAPWGDNSGDYHHQLFFNNGGIFYRNGSPDNTTWNGWSQVLTSGNISSNINGTVNYVPKFTGANSIGNSQIYDNGTNVGIGTTSSVNKLQIAGNLHMDGNAIFFRQGGSDQYDLIKWNSGTDRIDIGGYNGLSLGYTSTGGPGAITTVMTVSNGTVGIGITAPTQKLDVQGGNARINNTFIGDVGHGSTWAGFAHTSQANTTGYAMISSSDGNYTFINKQNTGGGYIGFRVANNDVAAITNGGNFGVGTTGPAERIHTTGNIRADGIVYWGNGLARTETRTDAGLQGNAGARSGFYENDGGTVTNYPSGASGWWHMIDVRHSNNANNYAMQFAGSFYDQRFYARKTNNSASTAWSELLTVPTGTNSSTNQAWTLAQHGEYSEDDLGGFGWTSSVDDSYFSANMGFNITINGTNYSDLTLNTNGTIVFGSQTAYVSYCSGGCVIPASNTTLPMLMWYWRDMVTRYRYGVVGSAPNRVYIIDFDSNAYGTGDDVDGQIQIHEGSGLINVFYRVMDAPVNGQNGTIGFQLNGGSAAKVYPVVANGKIFDDNRLPQSWSVCPVR